GYGYYENYKYDRKFSKYGLPAQIIGGESYLSSDFISRQIMDNDFYAATLSARYLSEKLTLNMGGMYSDHQGDHYGILPWVKYNEKVETDYQWYFNVGKKRDLNYFTKAEWRFSSDWSLFGDLQYRYVSYDMEGADNDLADLSQDHQWHFFNPKGGIFFRPDARNEAWFSVAVSHREPTRSDLKDAIKYGGTHEVLPERMTDFEAGYRYIAEKGTFVINGYLMLYKDQLTATGKLSNTGYALMENVKDSYRLGVEMTGGIKPLSWLSLDANLTLSRNRIQDYTGWIDQYDNPDDWNMVSQIPVYKKSSTLSFSPDVIAAGILTVNPVKPLSLALTAKYVGSQYYDNLASPENKIPSYLVSNFQATYTHKCKNSSSIEFQFLVNNLFNNDYIANAWAYTARFADGSPENTDRGFFVQAPRNIMSRITFRF
ncbi:MAG: TonB-dependent receptor, partial [Bacteroidales bacterium]|nr:TonB-dependent receptor [Bacteroidales bacterium]